LIDLVRTDVAKNAAILAAEIIGAFDPEVGRKMDAYKKSLEVEVVKKAEKLIADGWKNGFDH